MFVILGKFHLGTFLPSEKREKWIRPHHARGWIFTCTLTVSVDCYVEVRHIGRGSHTYTNQKILLFSRDCLTRLFGVILENVRKVKWQFSTCEAISSLKLAKIWRWAMDVSSKPTHLQRKEDLQLMRYSWLKQKNLYNLVYI